ALEQARQRQLPLLISGGGAGVSRGAPGEAALLAELAQGYGVTLWVEDRSRNTRENARNSAALLVRKGIDSVLLVTDRAHMPRAMLCFLHQRLAVQPAPLDSMPAPVWMPSAGALALLPEIWYEWLALAWYWLRRDF